VLLDRKAECEAIDQLLDLARRGSSRALVLRGEPGIGKSALLDYAVRSAEGMRVARIVGLEPEVELAFAGVHQLLAPMLERFDDLPAPQRQALAGAFGLVRHAPPDRFFVGLAVLTLLSKFAEDQPLLCIVDDAHWLDRASAETLAFVARRFGVESIALLFAVREPSERGLAFNGLPELHVAGLEWEYSRQLLASAAAGPIDRGVESRVIAETGGNPLALIELPGELTPTQLAGGSALPEPLPIRGRLEQSFLRRVRRLPVGTQTLLLLLAAEPGPDHELVWRAAGRLDLAGDAAEPAEADGLVTSARDLSFRHPLVRSAVYQGASLDERRRIHRALADDTSPLVDRDRTVWHRAAAAVGPDEDVAAELEGSADRARQRSGFAAAAARLRRAAELTPDRHRRAARSLDAARAELTAGDAGSAAALLAEYAPELSDDVQRAQAQRLRGTIDFELALNRDTSASLLEAARELESLDLRLARDTHLEALMLAMYAGPLGPRHGLRAAALAASAAPPMPEAEVKPQDLLLDGFALLFTAGHGAAEPTLRRAIDLLRISDDFRWIPLACHACVELWDDEAMFALATNWVQLAREQGALSALPRGLTFLGAVYEVLVGRFDRAEAALDEARELAAAVGNEGMVNRAHVGVLVVEAWRGREAQTLALADETMRNAAARGMGGEISGVHRALAVLENSRGHYEAAVTDALEATSYECVNLVTITLPELVEAAARSGRLEIAAEAVNSLAGSTLASGTAYGLGMLARSRALVASPGEADSQYQEAIDQLKRCRSVAQLARAHLLYGEWLRRHRRRRDARRELREAYALLDGMGASGFAERAAVELLATGERVRPREAAERLTAQEARIARLAAGSASNSEIAAQLFISPRTVEYHLSKVFRKLGLSSRTQLAERVRELAD
jgi:DNA-binding CsgD family transcriptional regulator